jgi:hypothetical protein
MSQPFFYCGFGVGFFFIIIAGSSPGTGGGAATFVFPRICRRSVSGSGIPGVGVAPFGRLFAFFGSGIPGVAFAEGGIGLVDNPGGKLFASTFVLPVPTD